MPRALAITDVAVFAGEGWRWFGSRRLRDRIAMGAGVALLVVGLVVMLALGGPAARDHRALPPTPPRPYSGGASATTGNATSAAAKAPPPTCDPGLKATGSLTPLRVCIPAIAVNATVIQLGLNPDRTVEVPPLDEVADAGWYRYSPIPGATGPTIILGHVDSAQYGQGVFFNLGRLRAGDTVSITRSDGAVATYRVGTVAEYPKASFPTQLVYGNTPGPTMRLITCGGRFDASTGNYVDNIVAFGDLVSLRPA